MFFACSGKTEINESESSEELMENEIWNPFIILSREENKIVTSISPAILWDQTDLIFNLSGSLLLNNDNYKYIPKDKLIPVHCINGIIEFSDGGFFCLEKKGKLTNESFLKSKYTGTYYYPNGNFFSGKFFKGKR